VTTEQLNGATVYHVATTADTTQIMDDLVKALNDPALSKATGSGAAALNQLKSSGELKTLEKSLTAASVEYWVDAKTFVVVKGKLDARLQFGGSSATQGVSGLGIDVTFALGNVGQPVKVIPPAHALPLKKLTNSLSGLTSGAGIGLLGGTSGGRPLRGRPRPPGGALSVPSRSRGPAWTSSRSARSRRRCAGPSSTSR